MGTAAMSINAKLVLILITKNIAIISISGDRSMSRIPINITC